MADSNCENLGPGGKKRSEIGLKLKRKKKITTGGMDAGLIGQGSRQYQCHISNAQEGLFQPKAKDELNEQKPKRELSINQATYLYVKH